VGGVHPYRVHARRVHPPQQINVAHVIGYGCYDFRLFHGPPPFVF
jgi:hypothetical protein